MSQFWITCLGPLRFQVLPSPSFLYASSATFFRVSLLDIYVFFLSTFGVCKIGLFGIKFYIIFIHDSNIKTSWPNNVLVLKNYYLFYSVHNFNVNILKSFIVSKLITFGNQLVLKLLIEEH